MRKIKVKHPLKKLQATLWSTSVKDLDIKKDQNYIIHQILAFGSIEEWRWLFKTYSLKNINTLFVKEPSKIYFAERFFFVKDVLLGLKDINLVKEYYVVNTPRIIRQKST